jgi:hypothetical protein
MAGINAGFVTGARAKIKIGGATMAFAADVSYNITVQTIPIETMGKYEVHTNEPVSYSVDGSFSIVRYTKNSANTSAIAGQNDSVTNKLGTGAGNNDTSNTGALSQGTAPGNHLDPSRILTSASFDLEILEKGKGTLEGSVFKINDCRITRRGSSLNKRGVLVDNYAFVAVLAGDNDEGAFPGISGMDIAAL